MKSRYARVSLCMIVRNEEQYLQECLAPVAHLFDQIVVVDTGSRDRTKQIARQFTADIHDFAWCDDFAAARNESLRHATGDWICWLDADDRLGPEQVRQLESLFSTRLDGEPKVFFLQTVFRSCGEAGGDAFVTSHARLFPRRPELKWHGRVHEQLRPEPAELGFASEFANIQIDHIGYLQRATASIKARRKLRLLRMDYAMDPRDCSTLLHLALALASSGARAQAMEALLKLAAAGDASQPHLRRVYASLADLAMQEGNPAEAAQFAAAGLRIFPQDMDLMFVKASSLYAAGDDDKAAALAQAIMHANPRPTFLYGSLLHLQSKHAPRLLAAVRRIQGKHEEAERLLLEIVRTFPDDDGTWFQLGLVYLDRREADRLSQVTATLEMHPAGRTNAGILRALWELRHGDLVAAGPLIDDLVATDSQQPWLRMLRVEWLSRMQASLDAQLEALADVLRLEPGNIEARRWRDEILLRRKAAAARIAGPPGAASHVGQKSAPVHWPSVGSVLFAAASKDAPLSLCAGPALGSS